MTPLGWLAQISYIAGLLLPFAVLWLGMALTAQLWPRHN